MPDRIDTRPVPSEPPEAAFAAVHAVADLLGHGKLAAAGKLLRALLHNGLPGEADLSVGERRALYRALARMRRELRAEVRMRLRIEARKLKLAHLAQQVRDEELSDWRTDELAMTLLVSLFVWQLASGRALPDDLRPLIQPWLPCLTHLPPVLEAPAAQESPRPAWVGPRAALEDRKPE